MPTVTTTNRSITARHGRGFLILSAVAFSTAGLFARAAPIDLWSMIVWRNAFGAVALAAVMLAYRSRTVSPPFRLGRNAWAVIALSAFATICYLAAFAFTSVADIAIIYATAPLTTAVAAWVWLGERPQSPTLAASIVALLGAAMTVAGSVGSGVVGDGLAVAMTLALSAVAVLARGTALPVLPTAALSSLLAAVAAIPFAWLAGADVGAIGGRDAAWMAAFGLVSMGVALPCYLVGARAVPAAEAMLIGAFEMPLGPFWVWLAFGEKPSGAALAGGMLVAAAVLFELLRPRPCP